MSDLDHEVRPVCIVGPTASGKSKVALEVARRRDSVELVSIDSMQVYRYMDIGTAKPSPAEQAEVRHHMIDIADPADEFTVSLFQQEWRRVAADIAARGRFPVLVGGTGLYLRSIIDDLDIPARYPDVRAELEAELESGVELYERLVELDPQAASRIDPSNDRRVVRAVEVTIGSGRPFSSFGPGLETYPATKFSLLGLHIERPTMDHRIGARYDEQMNRGFLDEVRALAIRPRGLGRTARQALGYRELLSHVELGEPIDDALEAARIRTRRFARRQQKWFERDPRIEWVSIDSDGDVDHGKAVVRAVELVDRVGQ